MINLRDWMEKKLSCDTERSAYTILVRKSEERDQLGELAQKREFSMFVDLKEDAILVDWNCIYIWIQRAASPCIMNIRFPLKAMPVLAS
jgi:hypothetical protein